MSVEDEPGADEPGAASGEVPAAIATPIRTAARGLIDRLVAEELLAVESGFDADQAADAVLEALERPGRRGPTAALADTLLEVPGVDELYADDATLERMARSAFEGT